MSGDVLMALREEHKLSLSEMLVLSTIDHASLLGMPGSTLNILLVLESAPFVTGVDLGCPEILDPDAIHAACERLSSVGYITLDETEGAGATERPQVEGTQDGTAAPKWDRFVECDSALAFATDVWMKLNDVQHEAMLTLMLCQATSRWEGWQQDGKPELGDIVRDKLAESLVLFERGLGIADAMKNVWLKAQQAES